MIRLLHSSDWHLGRHLYGRSLIEDQEFALARLLDLIDERKPHALLIAGDVFDRSVPPEEAVMLLNRFLTAVIRERNLPVFLIPGNHDSKERLGFAAELLRDRNLVIFAKVADALKPVPLTSDGGAKIWIHGIPYVEPMEIGAYLGEESLRTHDEALKALTRRMLENQVSREPHVLLCHAFALGGEISESEKEISIGGSSQVDVRAFDGFAYTALGHLHKPQNVGSERVRYSGSLLAYSKSETIAAAPETLSASGARATGKSVTEIRLDTDGGLELETFELPVLRRLRTIEGPLAELLERGREDQFRDDYIIAGFTDLGAQIDTFAKLRAVYPNLLHVSRVGGFLPSELPAARARAEERSERNDLDLFAEFFRDATGTELSDEERAALIETLAESAKGLAREEAG